ncbi:MAG TPA: cytochrome P450 [Pyrinomonadaceae bacterium]|jgi:cytochrome P450
MRSFKPTPAVDGPAGNRFFGPVVSESRRDPLGFMARLARDYGDLCTFRVGFDRVYFVNSPDGVREVLANHYEKFLKGRGGGRRRQLVGQGLLLSEGDLHRRQRRLAQPAFHRQRVAAYAAEMGAAAARCSDRWRDGETLDIWHEMLRTTLGIVGRTLFSADVEAQDDEVGGAVRDAMVRFRVYKLPGSDARAALSLPQLVRLRRGERKLRGLVLGLIEERRRDGRDRGDLLSMLMLSGGEGGGDAMTPEQLWQEALTIFIGGFDTVATALMWTFYALSQNPEAEARLHAELDSVLEGGRPASFEDLRRLPYAERVLCEAMRLYPPTWRLMRRALADFRVGGHVIPAGSLVVVSQYVMHRDARFWPDPERFDPGRWTAEEKAARPQYSFFPFGGGPRRCIGEAFAMTEGVMLLATLARRWRMRLAEGHRVEFLPQHLLRSKWGMRMRLERRAS